MHLSNTIIIAAAGLLLGGAWQVERMHACMRTCRVERATPGSICCDAVLGDALLPPLVLWCRVPTAAGEQFDKRVLRQPVHAWHAHARTSSSGVSFHLSTFPFVSCVEHSQC